MRTNKEQPLHQRQTTPSSSPQKGHSDPQETREEDRSIHKTKEDIRQVPNPQPDDDIIEHTSWERPQTKEDENRVL